MLPTWTCAWRRTVGPRGDRRGPGPSWSSRSRADGPDNLSRTSVPVLLFTYTADASTFPSTRDLWMTAAKGRVRNVDIKGGDHYLTGQTELVMQVAGELAAWAKKL